MRLDHLLSKEHTPRRPPNVWVRMVVFTSGIVDEWLEPVWWFVLSTARALWCGGVEPGWIGLVGEGRGTLLGPEGSGSQVLGCAWGLCAGCSGPPSLKPTWWVEGLVGLVFEIWIVDASIPRSSVS